MDILFPDSKYRSPRPPIVPDPKVHVALHLYIDFGAHMPFTLCSITAQDLPIYKAGGVMFEATFEAEPEIHCAACETRLAIFRANNPPDAEMRVFPLIPALQRMLLVLAVNK